MSDELTLITDRFQRAVDAVPKAQRLAVLEAVHDMVDVFDQARECLETKIKALEGAADAEASIKALADRAVAKIDQQQAQLDKMDKQLSALLAPTAATRRTAAARLRQ